MILSCQPAWLSSPSWWRRSAALIQGLGPGVRWCAIPVVPPSGGAIERQQEYSVEFHLLVADRPTGDGLVSAGGALYGAARECRVPDFVVLVLYSADGSGHSRQARQSFSWASRFFGIGAFCASPGVSPFGEGSPEVASIWAGSGSESSVRLRPSGASLRVRWSILRGGAVEAFRRWPGCGPIFGVRGFRGTIRVVTA